MTGIGDYITQVILPRKVHWGDLSQEQADRISKTELETLDAHLTPERRAEMAAHPYTGMDEESDFARP